MGASVSFSLTAAAEESKIQQAKRNQLLFIAKKNRQLMIDSWRLIILLRQVKADSTVVPGLTAFCNEFKRINESYGEHKLNLKSCQNNVQAGSDDYICLNILKYIMATKIESMTAMARITALGRLHVIVGKQDRLWQLFEVLLQTISTRLGAAKSNDVMDAWRMHFDAIKSAMTTSTIRLLSEVCSLRVSPCSSKHESVLEGDGEVLYDNGDATPTQMISLRGSLDSPMDHGGLTIYPNFAALADRDLNLLHNDAAPRDLAVAVAHIDSIKSEYGSIEDNVGEKIDNDNENEGNTQQTFALTVSRSTADRIDDFKRLADIPSFSTADTNYEGCVVPTAGINTNLANSGPLDEARSMVHQN